MTSLYTLTIFTSAFLLFLLQPMVAKLLLPHLGGSPAVWNTAMMFFQITLLFGYAYAHWGGQRLNVRLQTRTHLILMAVSLLFLPLAVRTDFGFGSVEWPVLWILLALGVSVGVPFLVLSATSSLLQSWLARSTAKDANNPYFLYSASNIGSLLALAAYPFVIEPVLKLDQQTQLWSLLYLAFTGLMAGCILQIRRHVQAEVRQSLLHAKHPLRQRAYWVLLAFVPSSLLLGVTTYITTDIASIPLLWIIPLAIYLLTFILAFAREPRMIDRALNAQVGLVPITALALAFEFNYITPVLLLHLFTFFAIAMGCHGTLSRARPKASGLTDFYFCLSLGGMLGGIFNALIAPMLFTDPIEYPLILALAMFLRPAPGATDKRTQRMDIILPAAFFGLLLAAFWISAFIFVRHPEIATDINNWLKLRWTAEKGWYTLSLRPLLACAFFLAVMAFLYRGHTRPIRFGLSIAAVLAAVPIMNAAPNGGTLANVVYAERNFFGVNRVIENKEDKALVLMHGTTMHGLQSKRPALRLQPLAYYGHLSDVFSALHDDAKQLPMAVIGLGTGSVACHGLKEQRADFYEIDPAVVEIAQTPEHFSYLKDCPAESHVVLGDGRLEIAKAEDKHYGLLVIDAFSSDALPMHLITREAFEIYRSKLAPRGLLLLNISNRHLNLAPVMAAIAQDAGWIAFLRRNMQPKGPLAVPSVWVVMAPNTGAFKEDFWPAQGWELLRADPGTRVWTDNYSNILQTLF